MINPSRALALCAALAPVCAGLALVAPAGAATPERGSLVRATKVAQLTPKQVSHTVRRWKEEGGLRLDTSSVRYGVTAYRLVYDTVGPDGVTPTTASGLIVLPRDGRRGDRVVAWEHGTTIYKGDAPSTGRDSDARLVSFLFSASGFVTIAPDYLGLGVGPGYHPYDHRPSEVSASVDMLRAGRAFVMAHGRTWDKRLLVSGFSQGGKVAIALGDALQRGVDPNLGLGAVSGVAGVYDIQGAQTPQEKTLDPTGVAFSLAYTSVAWKHLYGLYSSPSEVFRAPYDKTIEAIFDGHHTQAQVFRALPRTPEKLFTPAYLAQARHPSGLLLQGIQSSDGACQWAPSVPVRLYAARTDEQVSFVNTRHCQGDFRNRGVKVGVIDVGTHGHFGSELISVPRIVRWFRGMT